MHGREQVRIWDDGGWRRDFRSVMVVWRVGYRMHDVASRYMRAAASHWLVREIMYCTETCVRARFGVHRRAQRVVIPCGHVSYVSPTRTTLTCGLARAGVCGERHARGAGRVLWRLAGVNCNL